MPYVIDLTSSHRDNGHYGNCEPQLSEFKLRYARILRFNVRKRLETVRGQPR